MYAQPVYRVNATTLTLGLAQVDESNFGLARAELAAIGVLHSRARELLPYLEAAHKAAATVCPAAAAAMRNTKRQRKHDVDDSALVAAKQTVAPLVVQFVHTCSQIVGLAEEHAQ